MRFSIIIPTFNRPAPLDRCLAAVAALDYPEDEYETIVVDDGSDPAPRDIVARHSARLRLRYFRHERQGPARARNRGLREARGEYVAFTDDDCEPRNGWLRAFDDAFRRSPGAGLGGGIVDSPDNGLCGAASQTLVSFLYDYAATQQGNPAFFCSNNIAFPRLRLLDTGGFDETFPLAAAEDRDICARWLRTGEVLRFVPSAVVQHRQDLGLLSFCSQHYRYGRGAYQFWLRRRAAGEPGVRVESARFYWRLLTFPFGREPFFRAAAMFPLLALSQAACAAGYFAERRRSY